MPGLNQSRMACNLPAGAAGGFNPGDKDPDRVESIRSMNHGTGLDDLPAGRPLPPSDRPHPPARHRRVHSEIGVI
jgi:hypothetical protein